MADTPAGAPTGSQASIEEANRDRAVKSSHGGLGAAGYISPNDAIQPGSFLSQPGEIAIINPPKDGMQDFKIAVAWDNVALEENGGLLGKLIPQSIYQTGVDLDLGCLYRLKSGERGGVQALGAKHGALDQPPYIALSRDERTGDRDGIDEMILVNGAHWQDIEQMLLYVYIYDGAKNWESVRPQIQVRVPGEEPMVVVLRTAKTEMEVCAVAMIESVRGGIKMTSCLEYFPGHAEMDRAFGFGLEWEDGSKDE